MRHIKPIFTSLLWLAAALAMLVGIFGAFSLTGQVRVTIVNDNSAGLLIPNGSIEIATLVETKDVKNGDIILVGARGESGVILGEVLAKESTAENGALVTLKAPGFNVPDQWAYELGKTTYKHFFAIPFVGKPLAWAGVMLNPWIFGAIAALFSFVIIGFLRAKLFDEPPHDSDRWFKRLEPEYYGDSIAELSEIFEEQGAPALGIYEKKSRRAKKTNND